MPLLPATGTEITMGRTHRSNTNSLPGAGSNISLRATLGAAIGVSTGAISLSSRFGGRTHPYTY